MVIKPIEFAMIQQQNNVSKAQHNAETRPRTEQQGITQQVEKNVNSILSRLIKRTMLIMKKDIMMLKIKAIMNIAMKKDIHTSRKMMAGLL